MAEIQTSVEIIEQREVRLWSKRIQNTFGNPPTIEVASTLLLNDVFRANLHGKEDLKRMWNEFTEARQTQFRTRYGQLADLLYIPINVHALNGAVTFWDPTYRCFSFNAIELTPTIEEYTELLRVPIRAEGKIYNYEGRHTGKRALAKILGVQASSLDEVFIKYAKSKGKNEALSTDYLFQLVKQNMKEDKGLALFALCIYGLIVFPNVQGYVDIKVIKLFLQIQNGANPIVSILAETYRSLDFCRIQGKGKFIGCTPLLHIWLHSHLKCPIEYQVPQVTFTRSYLSFRNPISDYCRAKGNFEFPKQDVWESFFETMDTNDVIWKAVWMPSNDMTYRCGNYNCVPLLGPWGCTSYAPLSVLRQFLIEQFPPAVNGTKELEFDYDQENSGKKIAKMLGAWKTIKKIKMEKWCDAAIKEYDTWLINKKKLEFSNKVKRKVVEPEKIFEVGETSLQKRMILLEARASEAESDLVEARKLLKSQGKQLESQIKENQELDRENRRLSKVARRWKENSDYLQRRMEASEEHIKDLEGSIDALQRVISELNAADEEKRGQIVETEEINGSLRLAMENLQYRMNKCQSSAEKILQAYEHLKEEHKDLYDEVGHLRHQNEAHLFYINNAMQNLRMLCRRASVFADWGADLRGGLHFLQPNGEELMEFLSTLCRELRYLSRFM